MIFFPHGEFFWLRVRDCVLVRTAWKICELPIPSSAELFLHFLSGVTTDDHVRNVSAVVISHWPPLFDCRCTVILLCIYMCSYLGWKLVYHYVLKMQVLFVHPATYIPLSVNLAMASYSYVRSLYSGFYDGRDSFFFLLKVPACRGGLYAVEFFLCQ